LFIGTGEHIGRSINHIAESSPPGYYKTFCDGGINFVDSANIFTDPAIYTYSTIVSVNGSQVSNNVVSLTRCGFPTNSADATGSCSSYYDATLFQMQRFCPCDYGAYF
jgi:hypothetical protein